MKQQVLKGVEQLPAIFKKINCKKVFLVVDDSFQFLDIKGFIEGLFVETVPFSEFTSNPLYEQVCKGIELFKSQRCDAILAIGGGSAIDVAKCIKLAVLANEGKDALIPPLVNSPVNIIGPALPFIALPTTAGTGSESTQNAVLYYNDAKQTVTNNALLPNYAILEPSVLSTLPIYQKKCTMMDALCQGIESWWSVNSTAESKEYSQRTVEIIMQNWEKYIFDHDVSAAESIMTGANLSGRAINIAQTTSAHAMSYKITSFYHFPHGHAVSVCLPEIWDFMLYNLDECVDGRGAAYLVDVFHQIAHSMGCDNPTDAIAKFRHMMTQMELHKPVAVRRDEELLALSDSVNPVRLKNNPIKLNIDQIYSLYNNIVL